MAVADTSESVTELLIALRQGESGALDRIVECVYDELQRLAHAQLERRPRENSLNTTALVNELYCKLVEGEARHWHDRKHFYAACATAMRHLLVDASRRRLREKRGGGVPALTLDEGRVVCESDPEWIVELDLLINRLAEHDTRLVRVFECRYFGGFSVADTAAILGVSTRTVERDWARARAWLRQALRGAFESAPG